MKKLSFKEKLEIVRNIIRESLSGNAAFALLVYSLLHSLPIKTFADLFVTILLWICPYISRHLLSLNPLLACCRRYSRGER